MEYGNDENAQLNIYFGSLGDICAVLAPFEVSQ